MRPLAGTRGGPAAKAGPSSPVVAAVHLPYRSLPLQHPQREHPVHVPVLPQLRGLPPHIQPGSCRVPAPETTQRHRRWPWQHPPPRLSPLRLRNCPNPARARPQARVHRAPTSGDGERPPQEKGLPPGRRQYSELEAPAKRGTLVVQKEVLIALTLKADRHTLEAAEKVTLVKVPESAQGEARFQSAQAKENVQGEASTEEE